MPDDLLSGEDHEDDDDGPVVRIVGERPPLREGKVDYGERATIGANLEAACVALNQAFRGIWIEQALRSASTGMRATSTNWRCSPSTRAPRWNGRGAPSATS